ncbi:MAG: hypothetical protein H0U74_08165 [Bradymonadaceae bacterium]|nr:hypothetical protein [Lujinxingiaceae bacterium]
MKYLVVLVAALLAISATACDGKAPAVSNNLSDTAITYDTGVEDTGAEDTGTDVPSPSDITADTSVPDADVSAEIDVMDASLPDADTSVENDADAGADADTSLPDLACTEASDCGWCAFPTAPRTIDDCYCTGCPDYVLPIGVCETNASAWDSVCGQVNWQPDDFPCPQPRCINPPPTACVDSMCVDARGL